MKTKRIFLICLAALSFSAPGASAAMHGSAMTGRPGMARMGRPAKTRPASRFPPRNTMMGKHRFFNDRFHRFDRFHNRTFVFVDTFAFPFLFPYPYPYPYPYYGYYPYGYYGYSDSGYGSSYTVVEVQRRLARAGYYHGWIDGVMGPQTRGAIRAYERDHKMSAYGVIDRSLLATLDLS